MHLEQITYFLTLAEVLNFTKTAEKLYVSQPTVSRKIRLLEEELGITLFHRTTNSMSLTPEGKFLYEKFSDAYNIIQSSIHEVSGKRRNKHLVVGVSSSIGYMDFLARCYAIFAKDNSDVEFVYEKIGFNSLKEKLDSGSIDMIISTYSDKYNENNIVCIPLFESESVIVLRKGDPRSLLCHEDLSALSGDSLISFKEGMSAKSVSGMCRVCENTGFSYSNLITVPNLESVFFYVKAGMGVAILDESLARMETENFDFIKIPRDLGKHHIVAAYRESNDNPLLSHFAKVISKETKPIPIKKREPA